MPRFQEVDESKLGRAGSISEYSFGTSSEKVMLIQDCDHSKAVTVLIRGGSRTICDEAQRSLMDAICVVRNMIRENYVVGGGGATELSCAIKISKEADEISGIE